MELIFNQLSVFPLASNNNLAEERFKQLIKTYKLAKQKVDFKGIRFSINFSNKLITQTNTFYDWLNQLENKNLRNLILGLIKKPFIDDLNNDDLNSFYDISEYSIINIDKEIYPVSEDSSALVVAIIKSVPLISLNSHVCWNNRKINILTSDSLNLIAYNISGVEDLVSVEFNEWKDNFLGELIIDEESLKKYLGFEKYTICFSTNFLTQLFNWKKENEVEFNKILSLMKDVQIHPFTGGIGKTENLSNRGKEASKRITLLDRLSYSLANNIVTFIACKGHYNFHP